MRKIVVIVAIFIALFAGKSLAAKYFKNGNDLYALMTSQNYIERIGAIRYVQGAYDAIVAMKPELRTDIPDEIEAARVRDIVKLYLEKHPEIRHKVAPILVLDALKEAFSTKK